jgi:hypothetical protein
VLRFVSTALATYAYGEAFLRIFWVSIDVIIFCLSRIIRKISIANSIRGFAFCVAVAPLFLSRTVLGEEAKLDEHIDFAKKIQLLLLHHLA